MGAAALTGLYTYAIEPFWLEFVERDLSINNLPKSLVGATLMQISDIHVGDEFPYEFIIKSFEEAQSYEPDIVVHTGDYTTHFSAKHAERLSEVMRSAPQGKLGNVGILGNHDYGIQWAQPQVADATSTILKKNNIQVLRNTSTTIGGLNIFGLDDCWGTNFHPKPILQSVDSKAANLVLCHNPDVCDLDIWNNYSGWILAGHTHGGQCKPPFLPPPTIPVKNKMYTSGAFDLNDGRKLYINRALGNIYHIRFNVRPEITVFTLQRA